MTLVGAGGSDDALGSLADALHRAGACGMGLAKAPLPAPVAATKAADERIELAVVGAHLSGLPLNGELVALGATFVREGRTLAPYRLFALPGTLPPKPGLVRDPAFEGPGIAVEVWALEPAAFARFVAAVPAPLGIGRLALQDGSSPSGFLCEGWATRDAREITGFGGWRAFVQAQVNVP